MVLLDGAIAPLKNSRKMEDRKGCTFFFFLLQPFADF